MNSRPAFQNERERNMLVLSRKLSEVLMIGDDIKITIVKIDRNTVRIGIDAPKDKEITRPDMAKAKKTQEQAR